MHWDTELGRRSWGYVLLGIALGAFGGLGWLLLVVASFQGLWPMVAVGFLVAVLGLLLALFTLGAQLVAHGLRGGGPVPRTVPLSGAIALFLGGVIASTLLTFQVFVSSWSTDRSANLVFGGGLLGAAVAMFLLAAISWRASRGRPITPGWDLTRGACVIALPFFFLIVLFIVSTEDPYSPRRWRETECINNARSMAVLLSERSIRRGWPPYGGKNFVLSLVAYGLIDPRNPDNLEIFFCPALHGYYGVPHPAAYVRVTKEALRRRRFPYLTDFAGRRNDDPRYRLGGDEIVPILGCRCGDGVVLGFSDGSASCRDREDLGLGAEEPIVFGEASSSPLLRGLSDE